MLNACVVWEWAYFFFHYVLSSEEFSGMQCMCFFHSFNRQCDWNSLGRFASSFFHVACWFFSRLFICISFWLWFHRSMLFALFIRYAVSFVILRALSLCYYCLLLLFDCSKNRLQFSSGDVLCCGRFVFLSFHHTIPCRGVTSCFWAASISFIM